MFKVPYMIKRKKSAKWQINWYSLMPAFLFGLAFVGNVECGAPCSLMVHAACVGLFIPAALNVVASIATAVTGKKPTYLLSDNCRRKEDEC